MERRIQASTELRASTVAGKPRVSGYAARYGVLSHALKPGLKERIAKRAFEGVLRSNPDVVCTFNHDNNVVLGRTSAGTLRLRSDDKGLAFDCDLPNTTAARDLHESVNRGDIKDCSFAFMLGEGDDDYAEEDDDEVRGARVIVRTLRNFKSLQDVALVTHPAYPGTSVDARNLPAEIPAGSRSSDQRSSNQLPITGNVAALHLASAMGAHSRMFAK